MCLKEYKKNLNWSKKCLTMIYFVSNAISKSNIAIKKFKEVEIDSEQAK